jgi:S1-C subfamily serine protease
MEQSRAPAIAIGVAGFALVLSLIAVVVTAARGGAKSSDAILAVEATVTAENVVKLKRDVVEVTTGDPAGGEAGKVIGLKVTDEKLRQALGLEATDAITAISGRVLKRELDVYDALLSASLLDPSVLYVDIQRDGKPLLLKWKLDGDLKSARRADSTSRSPRDSNVATPSIDPFTNPYDSYGGSLSSRDPLLDTIKKIDATHYELPRSTIDRVLANPMDFAKGARVVPAFSAGRDNGLKLYAIRPNSIYASLGFTNGDTIHSINGLELTSVDKALELYTKLKDATSLEVELTRRAMPVTIKIDIK